MGIMQTPEIITGSRKKLGVFKTEKERTTTGGTVEPYKYTRTSIDTTGYSKGKPSYDLKKESGTGDKASAPVAKESSTKKVLRKDVPAVLNSLRNR
jgi:hypothetical protein